MSQENFGKNLINHVEEAKSTAAPYKAPKSNAPEEEARLKVAK